MTNFSSLVQVSTAFKNSDGLDNIDGLSNSITGYRFLKSFISENFFELDFGITPATLMTLAIAFKKLSISTFACTTIRALSIFLYRAGSIIELKKPGNVCIGGTLKQKILMREPLFFHLIL